MTRKRHFTIGETVIKLLFSVSLLQLNLAIQLRSRARVENSPPPVQLYLNFYFRLVWKLIRDNYKSKGGPPLFEERQGVARTFFVEVRLWRNLFLSLYLRFWVR